MKAPENTKQFIDDSTKMLDKIRTIFCKLDPEKEVDEDKARYVMSRLEDVVDDLVTIYGIQQLF